MEENQGSGMIDIVERLDRIKWIHPSPEVAGVIIDSMQEIKRLRGEIQTLRNFLRGIKANADLALMESKK